MNLLHNKTWAVGFLLATILVPSARAQITTTDRELASSQETFQQGELVRGERQVTAQTVAWRGRYYGRPYGGAYYGPPRARYYARYPSYYDPYYRSYGYGYPYYRGGYYGGPRYGYYDYPYGGSARVGPVRVFWR